MVDQIEKAKQLLNEGDDGDDDHEALVLYLTAWVTLPEPKEEQELAIEILSAIADTYFLLGEWENCCRSVQHAFRCGGDVFSPFLRLRLGQALYELGEEREATNWLVPAYLQAGRELFACEDPKYEFFHSKLDPPEEGWPEGW